MAKGEHLAILLQGVAKWNAWREENTDVLLDLREADLHRADLGAANLNGAVLIDADLSVADLRTADLGGANLSMANLIGADLRGAILRGADLSRARLGGADLSRADLIAANFDQAVVGYTVFGDNNLSETKGLETVQHTGPSLIGIDTIYKSKGKIPEIFLRGAGVPDTFIAYISSLTGSAVEFYSCFISYSTKDQEFADQLYADLQSNGVRCWFAPHDMAAGKKVHEQIDQAIRMYDKLLLILSPASMESAWVETEISKARKREINEGKRVLFPVGLVEFQVLKNWERLDADTGKDSAREIREYFIPDFSSWKDDDSYQKAFQRLLHDLKAESQKAQEQS